MGLSGTKRVSVVSAERIAKKLGSFLLAKRISCIDFIVRSSHIDFIARALMYNMQKCKKLVYLSLYKKHRLLRIKIQNVVLQLFRSHNGVRKAKARRV